MADVAVLGIRIENGQAIAAAKATGDALDSMAAKGSKAAVTIEQSRVAWARSGGDMRKFAQELQRMSAAQAVVATQTQAVAATQTVVATTAARAQLSVGRLGNQFASLAGTLAGVHPIAGNVASVLGNFAIGAGPMVAVLAGVAALAFAWQKVNQTLRDTEKAGKAAVDQLIQLADKRRLGSNVYGDLKAAAENERWLARESVKEARATIAKPVSGGNVLGIIERLMAQRDLVAGLERERRATLAIAEAEKLAGEAAKERAEEALKITQANEDRIRLASQAFRLVGEEGVAAARLRVEHEAINAAIEARRSLTGKALDDTLAAIEKAKEISLKAVNFADALEQQKKFKKVLDEMRRDAADFFEDIFTTGVANFGSLFDSIKKMFIRMLAEMAAARLAQSMAGMIGTAGASAAGSAAGGAAGAAGKSAMGALGAAAMAHPYIAAAVAVVAVTAALWSMRKSAADAARELAALRLAQTSVASTLASWRAQITGTAADQKAAAALELKLKYLNIQADIERLLAGKKNEAERNKALAEAADLYAKAQKGLTDGTNAATSSMLNMVQGYKLQAAIFAASGGRTSSTGGGGGGSGGGGGGGGGEVGPFTVNLVLDGAVVGTAVLRDFKRRSSARFGVSTRWSEIT